MNQQKLSFFLFLLLFSFFRSQSQITISQSVGCVPNGITNANLTYLGPPAASLLWNFGDGSPTSSLPGPQHSYINIGSYTVSCVANSTTYTLVVIINPAITGSGSFVIPQSHCLPMTVTFSGSSPSPNVFYSWDFGDNNSIPAGVSASTVHTYNTAGVFAPILSISNSAGCIHSVTFTNTPVKVSAPPTISVTSSNGYNSCAAPFSTVFNANTSVPHSPIPSAGGSGLTFFWNFGNSQTSNVINPSTVTYNTQNNYLVSVTATDNNSCSKTSTFNVSVLMPTVSFTVPPSVCIKAQTPPLWANSPAFSASVVSSQTSTVWDMGDGSPPFTFPYIGINPPLTPNVPFHDSLYAYSSAGTKTITVSAYAGNCVAVQTQTIFVELITPAFVSSPPHFSCQSPLAKTYTNQTTINSPTTSLTYTWSMSHWNQNAPSTYFNYNTNATFNLQQGSLNPFTIYQVYKPSVTLLAQSSLGCVAFVTHTYDSIQVPNANFNMNKKEGCVPLTVTFRDSSMTFNSNFTNPIVSYTWCNGAPSNPVFVSGNLAAPLQPTSSVIPNQVFTYTAVGVYHPYLMITTALGCTATAHVRTVTVSNPPAFTYTLPSSPVCAGVSSQFTLAAVSPATINHWHIESDNGFFSDCTTDLLPSWKFTHPGVQNFTISAYQNGCKTESIIPQTIVVKGPVAKLRYETNCSNKKSVNFYYHLQDVQTAQLSFGDGTPTITIAGIPNGIVGNNMVHVYASTGDYTATIKGFNTPNACGPYTFTTVVTVREPIASFTMPAVSCRAAFQSFTAGVYPDNLVGCGRGYTWFIDNRKPIQSSVPLYVDTFSNLGFHTIRLLVKDVNGCTDEMTQQFRISAPAASFNFAANPVCFSDLPVNINNTTPQLPDAVNNFTWTYVDNYLNSNAIITSNFTTTLNAPVPFNTLFYSSAPTKTTSVLMIAKNSYGCIDSMRKNLTINNPLALILFIQNSCIPGPATQIPALSSPTYTNYTYFFGDGQSLSSTTAFTTHVYSTPGIYSPTLEVTDFGGCKSRDSSQTIEVHAKPVPSFTYVSNISNLTSTVYCLINANLGFTNNAISSYPVNNTFPLQYIWDLGSGPPTGPLGTTNTAGKTYTAAGTYTAKITSQTSAPNCSATQTLVINVYDPKADFDLDKDKYCLGSTITLSTQNVANTHHLQWDFGDSQPTGTFVPSQTITFYNYNYFPTATNGSVTIILTAASPGNECKDVKTKTIQILRILADFNRNAELTLNDYANCLGTEELFKDISTTNSNSQLDYSWNLGNGTNSTLSAVNYTYPSPGNYVVNLHITDPVYGCEANASKTMTIFPLPTASLDVSPRSCPGAPFLVKGGGSPGLLGTLSGTLSPSYGSVNFSPNNTFTLNTTASISTVYSLNVRDENGCQNKTVFDSIYIQPPAPAVHWDTTVVIGQPIPLNAWVGSNFTYTWTPIVNYLNCDTCLIYNPISTSTLDITYSVSVQDTMHCSISKNTYKVHIDIITSIDVPTAFTPNGDGNNDIIYPDGWGIRKLLYFRIYNRWGQLLFESNDIKLGWNGVFNGVPQNMETYVYQVSVETFKDEVLSKSGTIKLIR